MIKYDIDEHFTFIQFPTPPTENFPVLTPGLC